MQYSQNKRKKNTSVFWVIAVCVIAIVCISYLAVVKSNKKNNKSENEISSDESSYNSNEKSSSNNEDNTFSEKADDIKEKAGEIKDKAESEISKLTENKQEDVPYGDTENNAGNTPKQTYVIPIKGSIIKDFSETELQYDKTYGDMRLHTGIDIACENNAKVVSATSGTVTDISENTAYGTIVTVDHGNGITVKYCGIAGLSVEKGSSLNTGDLIGMVKTPPCECMDESHIHIECFKDGKSFSPLKAFGIN